jgi:hypothetical protein
MPRGMCFQVKTGFGHHYAHHDERFQTAVAASGFRLNAEVDVFPAENMFRAPLCPSSGALSNCSHSLRFPSKCRGGCVSSWKHIHLGIYTETGNCDCSLKELLMMGIMVPETCWAASMRLNSKFYDWLLHLLGVLFEYLKMHGTTNSKFPIFFTLEFPK